MTFGRLERPQGSKPMSDINMTPLIDVMLVLLVIFIITAPLLASSLKLELPKSDAASPSTAPTILALSIDAQGTLRLKDELLDAATLATRAQAAAKANPQTEVQLRADSSVPYGRVAETIGIVQKAGLLRIGLITAPAGAALPTVGAAPPTVGAASAPP
jgi:biopolymer transport protein TolR